MRIRWAQQPGLDGGGGKMIGRLIGKKESYTAFHGDNIFNLEEID